MYTKPSFHNEPKRPKTIGKDLSATKIDQWNKVIQNQDIFFSQDDGDTEYYLKHDPEPLINEKNLETFSDLITAPSSEVPIKDNMGERISAFLKEEGISIENCVTNEELQNILGNVELVCKKKAVYSKPDAYPTFEDISPPASPDKEINVEERNEKTICGKSDLLRKYGEQPDIGQNKAKNIVLSLNENLGLDEVDHSALYYYRDPKFYEDGCYVIGLIRVKKHFDKNAAAWFIFIKKENVGFGSSSCFPPSIFRLTHEEAEELSEHLEVLQEEISKSAKTEIPRLVGHKPIESFSESFWEEAATTRLKSDNLIFRPYRHLKNGILKVKFLAPKKSSFQLSNWLGATMNLSVRECDLLLLALNNILKEIRATKRGE